MIKKIKLIRVLLVFALLFACVGCEEESKGKAAQKSFEIDNVYERGPVTVHVRLDKGKISIAETLVLELEAAVSSDYEIEMPKVDELFKDFGVLDFKDTGKKVDEQGNVVTTHQYRLEPFLSGQYSVPAFTFVFFDVNETEGQGQGQGQEIITEPIEVEVTSLLGEDRENLVIGDIEDVVVVPKKASYWWVYVAVLIAVAVAGVWFYSKRKIKEKLVRVFRSAHEIAYERLAELVAKQLVEAGKVKEFYEEISDILRHYIEHRFGLRAPERTTEEFLVEMKNTDQLAEGDKESLGEFLGHCDMVKFAKSEPTGEQIQGTFDLVKEFIEKTKADERKVDVTDMVTAEEESQEDAEWRRV